VLLQGVSMAKPCRVFLVLLLVAPWAFGQNGLKPVELDSPVYRWLSSLYSSAGLVIPSRSAPFTSTQLLSLVDDVAAQRKRDATASERELEQAIRAALVVRPFHTEPAADDTPGLAVAARHLVAPELYLGLGAPTRWTYGYNDRPPLYQVVLEAWMFPWVYGALDLQIQKDPFVAYDQLQPVTNAPTDMEQVDFAWPYWGGLIAGGEHWDVRFFRSHASYAVAEWNLTLSRGAGEVDQLSLNTWWKNFQYSFLWIPVDNTLTTPSLTYGYPSTAENDSSNAIPYDKSRNFVTHRLQFRPHPSWSFTLTEIFMYEGAVFDPRYLNPMIPGHNWFIFANANSDISLELEGSPLPGWTLWGQFYGDYIKTAFKDAKYNDPTPGAIGYLLGSRLDGGWGDKRLSFEIEGVYADPFLYLNNHVNMLKTTRVLSNYGTAGRRMIDTPFGFELGPDTIAVRNVLVLEAPGRWSVELGLPFQVRGENTIRTIHPLQAASFTSPAVANPLYGHPEVYLDWMTPTGVPEWKQGVHLAGESRLPLPWDSSLGVSSTFAVVWNRDHVVSAASWDWQSAITWTNKF